MSAGYRAVTFATAREFLDLNPDQSPGCLVLDVRMPDLNGLDLQEKLKETGLTYPIIFITGHGDIPTSVKAMKAGAVDFLPKPFDDLKLLDAIDNAIEKDIRARGERERIEGVLTRIDILTPREYQVFRMVIGGMLNKQIAYSLGISEKTVKVHRSRVMRKMQADSLANLVRLAEWAGIEPVTD